MNHVTLDFETRSECDIRKAGAWAYSAHPSTEVLCLAYKIPDQDVQIWIPSVDGDDCPKDLDDAIQDQDMLFEAHNAQFEQFIWENVLTKRLAWPMIPIERWRCSAAKAASISIPRSLEGSTMAMKLPIQKDVEGNKLMLRLCKPKKPSAADPGIWDETPWKMARLFEYCKNDVIAEEMLSESTPDLSPFEQRLWFFDQKMNRRGIPIDVELVKAAIEFCDGVREDFTNQLKEITEGALYSASQLVAMTDWLGTQGVSANDVTAPTVKELLAGDLPENARRVLHIRQLLSKASVKKFPAMMLQVDQDDHRIRGSFLYHAASTGRWGGRGFQPQNLSRGILKEEGIEEMIDLLLNREHEKIFEKYKFESFDAVASIIRSCIKAPDGKKFIAGDYSSIESRALFWLCGETAGLEVYRTTGKIYEDMAGTIYGVHPSKIGKDHRRQLGKQAVLGCGYGMGWKKFMITCEGYGMDVDAKLAKKTVEAYRNKYSSVTDYWKANEWAAIDAVKNPGKNFPVGEGKAQVVWRKQGNFLWCRLPSGRKLSFPYASVKIEETKFGTLKEGLRFWGVNSQTYKWEQQRTYGGSIVESITQAVARDLMAYSLLELEAANYPVIMTVHDEAVAEVDEDFGSVEEFEKIMSILPDWAEGLPIEVEAWEGKRFKK